MSLSSSGSCAIATPLPGAIQPVRTRLASTIWLAQLAFPTLGLIQFGYLVFDGQAGGRFGLVLIGSCLVWYGLCLAALARPRIKSWIGGHSAQLLMLYVSITAGLVATELACRWKARADVPADLLPRFIGYSREMGWNLTPGVDDIGENGWRRPVYPQAKQPGHFRVVCIGDSTTFSQGCTWEEAWPHQLEIALNENAAWSKKHGVAEVLNLGVLGYGPDQSLLALQKLGLAYAPEVVVFHLCLNDFADVSFDHSWLDTGGITRFKPYFVLDRGRLQLARDYAPLPRNAAGMEYQPENPAHADVNPFTLRLALVPLLRDRLQTWTRKDTGENVMAWPEQFWPVHEALGQQYSKARPLVWALIKEMARVSQAAGAQFFVTLSPANMNAAENTPPWRVGSFVREYEEDGRAAGVNARHCVPEYFRDGGAQRFARATDKSHLNAQGNAYIAQATMRWLTADDRMARKP
jgi:lysophospholipase L1-like esterase